MNNDEILKLANDMSILDAVDEYDLTDNLLAFYRAAYNKAIEDAAEVLGEAWEDARKEYEGYGGTGNQCNPYYEGHADCADISTTEIRGLKK